MLLDATVKCKKSQFPNPYFIKISPETMPRTRKGFLGSTPKMTSSPDPEALCFNKKPNY